MRRARWGIGLLVCAITTLFAPARARAQTPTDVRPTFVEIERRADPRATYDLNAFEVIHVEATSVGVLWNTTTTCWRVSRGAYRHPMKYEDFYRSLGRPDLADAHASRHATSQLLFWGGFALMAGGLFGGGYELYKGHDVGAIVGAGVFVGGFVSMKIGGAMSGPTPSEEEAQDMVRRYNDALGRHLGLTAGGSF
jgi:hypothetical protein